MIPQQDPQGTPVGPQAEAEEEQATRYAASPPAADPAATNYGAASPAAVDAGATRYPEQPADSGTNYRTPFPADSETNYGPASPADPAGTRYPPADPHATDYKPTERKAEPSGRLGDYELLEEIGQGGMGVVYRARHLPTGEVVALKTLQRLTPAALDRFKQEFRVVAGLAHPNLVTLRHLVSGGATCFFTMELLDGVELRTHVWGAATPPTRGTDAAPLWPEASARLRQAFGQLAAGVAALHAAGVLHRDVKPANVLVTPTGRVVLLDFGLAGELRPDGLYQTPSDLVAGTPAYMAPEQAAGAALSPAADWYAVGVVLYELLAGRLPFAGTVNAVLRDKQHADPPPPSRWRAGVPADLERLCLDLLRRDPARRPAGAEVRRRLGVAPESDQPPRADRPDPGLRLFGRDDHLRILEEAFTAVGRGAAVCVRVHGPSGSGKSALVRSFLDRLAEDGAVALAGRCHEQELLPYKAFDGVIDALSRHLAELPSAEAAALLPRDVAALTRLFPVLGRVAAVAATPPLRGEAPDAREARRRGLGALRELLARLGDRRPLVVFVDDFQWGDADSVVLLEELLHPPDPPPLLVLVCYRSEDADSPTLRAVGRITPAPPALLVTDLPVGPLSAADARGLAAHLLGGAAPAAGLAEVIAREAGGNPFYVGELAESARAGLSVAGGESLDRLLWHRVQGLPRGARRLLQVVTVGGAAGPPGRRPPGRRGGRGLPRRPAEAPGRPAAARDRAGRGGTGRPVPRPGPRGHPGEPALRSPAGAPPRAGAGRGVGRRRGPGIPGHPLPRGGRASNRGGALCGGRGRGDGGDRLRAGGAAVPPGGGTGDVAGGEGGLAARRRGRRAGQRRAGGGRRRSLPGRGGPG